MLTRGAAKRTASGEAPLVRADTGPVKVAPQNPGGVEIPNQNKQIFERGAPDAQTRVVNRQEQPIDVRQAARGLPPAPEPAAPVVLPPPGSAPSGSASTPTTNPPGAARPNTVSSALGEPRRVRTVTVKPDGSIDMPSTGSTASELAPPPRASAPAAPPVVSASPSPSPPAPTSSRTPVIAAMPLPSAAPAAPPAPTAAPAAQRPAPTPPPAAAAPTRTEPARTGLGEAPLAFPAPAPPKNQAQIAAATGGRPSDSLRLPPSERLPEPGAGRVTEPVRTPEPARAPSAAAAAASEPATGGFSVQIGTRTTEAEARAAFEQISARYASILGGHQALIRRTELNGKTVFRVRVGPSSGRAQAVDLCVKLKAAGGECFVSAN